MQKSLLGVLVSSGVLLVAIGACTMKAPQDVSQAAAAAQSGKTELAAAKPVTLPETAKPAVAVAADPSSASAPASVDASAKTALKPAEPMVAVVATTETRTAAADGAAKPAIKPSRLSTLASAAGSLPLLSMMRGEDGRISPINMMMKIRSMMPMCAGGNCVTTSTGFQRVSGVPPVKQPLTLATAG